MSTPELPALESLRDCAVKGQKTLDSIHSVQDLELFVPSLCVLITKFVSTMRLLVLSQFKTSFLAAPPRSYEQPKIQSEQ